jgi:hypothetical protein
VDGQPSGETAPLSDGGLAGIGKRISAWSSRHDLGWGSRFVGLIFSFQFGVLWASFHWGAIALVYFIENGRYVDNASEPFFLLFVISVTILAAYSLGAITVHLMGPGKAAAESKAMANAKIVAKPEIEALAGFAGVVSLKAGQRLAISVTDKDDETDAKEITLYPSERLTPAAARELGTRSFFIPLCVVLLAPLLFNLVLSPITWMHTIDNWPDTKFLQLVVRYAEVFVWSATLAFVVLVALAVVHGAALGAVARKLQLMLLVGVVVVAASALTAHSKLSPFATLNDPYVCRPAADSNSHPGAESESAPPSASRAKPASAGPSTATGSSAADLSKPTGAAAAAAPPRSGPGGSIIQDAADPWSCGTHLLTILIGTLLSISYATGAVGASLPRNAFIQSPGTRSTLISGAVLAVPVVIGLLLGIHNEQGKISIDLPFEHVIWPIVLIAVLWKFQPNVSKFLDNAQTIKVKAFGSEWSFSQADVRDQNAGLPITSFQELMRVVINLIKNTKRYDAVRIMAYTPALGYLARPEAESDSLIEALHQHGDRIRIACLKREQLWAWHAMFCGKRTARGLVGEELIEEANRKSEFILEGAHRYRKNFEELPDYYAFANRETAVIVVPFAVAKLDFGAGAKLQKLRAAAGDHDQWVQNLLRPNCDLRKQLEERRVWHENASKGNIQTPVEMFGIVTNDPRTVQYVHDVLDQYLKGECEEPINKADQAAYSESIKFRLDEHEKHAVSQRIIPD